RPCWPAIRRGSPRWFSKDAPAANTPLSPNGFRPLAASTPRNMTVCGPPFHQARPLPAGRARASTALALCLDPFLDQLPQQRPVAMGFVFTRGRTEQGDRLPFRHQFGQLGDEVFLLAHFFQVTPAVFLPADRRAVLAVEGGVQLPAGAEVGPPGVPGLVLPGAAPPPVTPDPQAG